MLVEPYVGDSKRDYTASHLHIVLRYSIFNEMYTEALYVNLSVFTHRDARKFPYVFGRLKIPNKFNKFSMFE